MGLRAKRVYVDTLYPRRWEQNVTADSYGMLLVKNEVVCLKGYSVDFVPWCLPCCF